jgi:hypothetical protein
MMTGSVFVLDQGGVTGAITGENGEELLAKGFGCGGEGWNGVGVCERREDGGLVGLEPVQQVGG